MKAKTLKRIETLTAALLLTLLLGCGPAKPPESENPEAAKVEAAKPEAAKSETATPPAATPATGTPAAAQPADSGPAAGMTRWEAAPTGSKVKMEGTSNLHDWTMESTIVGGYLDADPGFPANTAGASVQVFMPVRSFKSSGGKVMDNKMQSTMKETQFKRIEYKLLELKAKTGDQYDAVGVLTISGQSRTNTMPVTVQKVGADKLKVTGSTALKMTAYGVEPPSLTIAGVGLTTGDDLKVNFEWLLAKKAP